MFLKYTISFVVPFYKNVIDATKVLDNIVRFIGTSEHNIEVILINDSGDNSDFIINKDYNFPLQLINLKKNTGVTGARNFGYNIAKGEYVFFFDSDDFLIESKYESTLYFLTTNKFDVVLFRCIDEKNRLIGKPKLEILVSKSPNFFYGNGECLVVVKKNKTKPFIGFFRGNEHVGLLRYALLNYPARFACSNFPIRIYTNNQNGLSSKINTPQRAFLMSIAHFLSSIYSLLLLELFWAIRFCISGFFRLFKLLQSLIKILFC